MPDTADHHPSFVRYDMADRDTRLILDLALEEFAASQRDKADADPDTGDSRLGWAARADQMRQQAIEPSDSEMYQRACQVAADAARDAAEVAESGLAAEARDLLCEALGHLDYAEAHRAGREPGTLDMTLPVGAVFRIEHAGEVRTVRLQELADIDDDYEPDGVRLVGLDVAADEEGPASG